MNVPVNVNGMTVEIPIDDAIIEEAIEAKKRKEKKTGYERNPNGPYYYSMTRGDVDKDNDFNIDVDSARYEAGNYYTCQEVADNNVRADNLVRQLRRFAAEHGGCGKPVAATYVGTKDYDWTVCCAEGVIQTRRDFPNIGVIHFKDEDTANAAIEAFRDELTWYFTEYDPMPEGWWGD